MKFLLTNDDGIDAPGLQALLTAATALGTPVLVAPLDHHSGCSHRVTCSAPIRVEERPAGHFAVDGTPADCVRIALHDLTPSVDWVLSGVNHGGNLGADVYISGTVAAVREAVLHGRPGIAVSQYQRRGLAVDWATVAVWVERALREVLQRSSEPGAFWNINLPHLEPGAPPPDIVFCPLDPGPLPLSFRREGDVRHYDGNYHSRHRKPGADVDVCFGGRIAVTRLSLY